MADPGLRKEVSLTTDEGFTGELFLPPANEVCGKVIFLHMCVILSTGGHAWLPGACMVATGCVWLWGGMHGWQGACMVAGGHVWLLGTCVVAGGHVWLPGVVAGGMCGCGGHA